jgi:hypothetical protein
MKRRKSQVKKKLREKRQKQVKKPHEPAPPKRTGKKAPASAAPAS